MRAGIILKFDSNNKHFEARRKGKRKRDHQRWQRIDPKTTNRPHKDYTTL